MIATSHVSQNWRFVAARSLGWLLLPLFMAMPLGTTLGVPGATTLTDLCGLGWLGGTALLLWALRKPARETLWAWAIFFVFATGYYGKFLAFAYGMGTPPFMLLNPELAWANHVQLDDALVPSTIGYLAFVLTAALLIGRKSPAPGPDGPRSDCVNPRNMKMLLVGTFVGVVISLVAAVAFGFGQMGLEHHELPFHLDSLFTRFRVTLAPAIYLTVLWVSDYRSTRGVWVGALFLMALSAVGDAYVRGSRGSIALAFLPLMIMWALCGTYTGGRRVITAAVVLGTIGLYPLLTAIRIERISSKNDVSYDREIAAQQATTAEGILLSLDQVAGRVVGIDSMMQILRDTDGQPAASGSDTTILWERLPLLASESQMVSYMTYKVIGIPTDQVEGRSPGFLGGTYLVGGLDGMTLLTILYVVGIWFAWIKAGASRYAPPLLAYLAVQIMSYTQEGTYGLENPLSTVIAMALVPLVFDRLVRSTRTTEGPTEIVNPRGGPAS